MASSRKVRVKKIEETYFGKLLQDPIVRKRYDEIVKKIRQEVQPEIEAMKRSERITWQDLHGPTFY